MYIHGRCRAKVVRGRGPRPRTRSAERAMTRCDRTVRGGRGRSGRAPSAVARYHGVVSLGESESSFTLPACLRACVDACPGAGPAAAPGAVQPRPALAGAGVCNAAGSSRGTVASCTVASDSFSDPAAQQQQQRFRFCMQQRSSPPVPVSACVCSGGRRLARCGWLRQVRLTRRAGALAPGRGPRAPSAQRAAVPPCRARAIWRGCAHA